MMISEMIERLTVLHQQEGDLPVTIIDDHVGTVYSGAFLIQVFEGRTRKYIDIRVGGLEVEE